ncbi:TonB-linked outer membrane protein, SusC/RagA family [Bacteroidales bacterium WCE2008]|nr:TonB-linked outer membrane protein, SusC/RagA family [Bacteroidales bacterium WCE2008]
MKRLSILVLLALSPLGLFAQNSTVKGTITDAGSGEPLPFATVVVNGTSNWTTSDKDGLYSIEAASNAVISVSLLGYATVEENVNGRTKVDFALIPEFDQLTETVVVGYGVQQKKLVTGSTIQVKGDELMKMSQNSALGALQSQTPGVNITQNSGQPGQGFKVNIRGIGTIGDSEPLYVIDGVPGGDINALNPSDIESIDVLKDAATAAIYGSRAANGVVLVTTKQGKEGRVITSYDGYVGMQYIANMPKLCNAQQYIQLQDLANTNSGSPVYDWATLLPSKLYQSVLDGSWKGTNWVEEMYNKGALTQNHSINVTGGSQDMKYSLGLSYTGQDGVLGYNKIEPVNAEYRRYTLRINSDIVVKRIHGLEVLKVGETLNGSYGTNNGIAEGDIYWNSLHNAITANPLLPVYTYDEQGNVTGFYDEAARDAEGWEFDGNAKHPLGMDYYTSRGRNTRKSYNLQTSVYAEVQPIKDLKFKTQFGYKMSGSSSRSYTMLYRLSSGQYSDNDEIGQGMSLRHGYIWENTLSYKFSIKDQHVFDVVLGLSFEKSGFGEKVEGSGFNSIFPNDFDRAYLNNARPKALNQFEIAGRPHTINAIESYFGRINYAYKDTYLFSFILRRDGSSNFGKGYKYGYFPSLSAGWIISNEPWMEGTSGWLNFLKLRGGWGQNGNQQIDPFQYLTTIMLSSDAGYYFGNKAVPTTGAVPDVLGNPVISWETSEQSSIGIDARFLNSALGVTVDGYIKDTRDWLVKAPIVKMGFEAPYVNGGAVRNSGVELAIDYGKYTGEFNYGIKVNGAYNKNKVTKIDNGEGIIHGKRNVLSQGTSEMYRAQVGYPIGFFYGYKTAGIFQNDAQVAATAVKYEDAKPGDVIFVDTDGDGAITEEDRTMIGNPHPDFTTGINLWFSYKGFDLNISGHGAFGQQIAKSYRSFFDSPRENYTTDFLDCWHGEGTSNRYPTLTLCNDRNWSNISDIYIENGDFFKISNVTIGYDFSKLIRKSIFSKARVYLAAQNLYTFTGYSGMDPEIGYGFDESWVSGIDLGYYPGARTYMIGVNLQF